MAATFRARVFVTLKESVLDPQGQAVQQTLHSLGHGTIDHVRIGKLIEFSVQAADEPGARKVVDDACRELLVNPVIETYSFEVEAGQKV